MTSFIDKKCHLLFTDGELKDLILFETTFVQGVAELAFATELESCLNKRQRQMPFCGKNYLTVDQWMQQISLQDSVHSLELGIQI